MMASSRFRIVFVLGIAHGGSTLLGRMLNRHPDILCPGELLRLPDALADPAQRCSCGESIRKCPVWERRIRALPNGPAADYRKWTPQRLKEMATREKAHVLLDLSKTRAYRLAKKWTDPEVGFLFVIRDPRGALRDHAVNGGALKEKLKVHKKWTNRLVKHTRVAGERVQSLYYEDLVTDPRGTLTRVCAHIGIDFRDELLRPDDGDPHFVHSSRSSYRKGENRFTLDERWREQLSEDQLALIETSLGSLPVYRDRYFRRADP